MDPARLEALQRENERLRERVAWLESLLSGAPPLPIEWQLTALEECVVGVLLNRPVASREQIHAAAYGARSGDGAEIKIVDVLICKIRRKLKPFGIDIRTHWGRGYSIDDGVRETYRSTRTTAAATREPEGATTRGARP